MGCPPGERLHGSQDVDREGLLGWVPLLAITLCLLAWSADIVAAYIKDQQPGWDGVSLCPTRVSSRS